MRALLCLTALSMALSPTAFAQERGAEAFFLVLMWACAAWIVLWLVPTLVALYLARRRPIWGSVAFLLSPVMVAPPGFLALLVGFEEGPLTILLILIVTVLPVALIGALAYHRVRRGRQPKHPIPPQVAED